MVLQKSKTPDWNDLQIFLVLARSGTLTAAAEKAGMAPSSIARHIEELERALHVVLFQRSPQGYVLTDVGRLMQAHAESAEAAIDALVRQSLGLAQDVTGSVRIAMPENFANHLVIPALGDLRSRYPDLMIEIVTDVRQANLSRREADMAIRLSKPSRGDFLAAKIGEMENALFASENYLANHPFESKSRGHGHFRIDWDETLRDLPLVSWLESVLPAAKPILTTTSLGGQVGAAEAGLGIAALPILISSDLKRLDDRHFLQDIFLITHRDSRNSPRISVVVDFLREVFHRRAHELRPSRN